MACNSDNGAKVVNSTPEATITFPSDGDSVFDGDPLVLRGNVNDANHSFDALSASWFSGAETLCESTTPESDGTVQCEITASADLSEISLQVLDPSNAMGMDTIVLFVTPSDAPTLNITAPDGTENHYSDQLILFSAIAADSEDAPEDLWVTWTSSLDGALSVPPEPDSNGVVEQLLSLSEGQHAITVVVEDTSGKTATETLGVNVGPSNSSPSCSISEPLDEGGFTFGQSIEFEGIASDPDINNALLYVNWISDIDGIFNWNGPDTEGDVGFSYDGLSVGNHSITFYVEDEVGALCTDSIQIVIGTPPQITISSPSDGDVYNLGALVNFEALVSDGEDILSDISVSWVSNLDAEFSVQGSDSNGNISFSEGNLSAGEHMISVTATDTSGLIASDSTTIVINTAPVVSSVSISPNSSVYNTTLLTCTASVIDPDELLSPSYEWQVGGVVLGTGTSFDLSAFNIVPLDIVVCTAVATDSQGLTASGTDSVTVENRAPSVDTLSISPTLAYTDSTINASATFSDLDQVQNLSETYTWHVISHLTGIDTIVQVSPVSSLNGTFFNRDDQVYVVASVSDGIDSGPLVTSNSITIANSPPEAAVVSISPNPADDSNDLYCNVTTPSTDLDGDSVSYNFQWFLNGVLTLHTTNTISASETTTGDTWLCLLTPYDGTDQGGGTSDTITIIQIDSDGDGVIDSEDLCPGYDDAIDTNSNGIPDGCESSLVYDFTGSVQTFVVPQNTSVVFIQSYGASGGDGEGLMYGGLGGMSEASIPVVPGETLEIYVGGAGGSTLTTVLGGFNGGGDVNQYCCPTELSGSGGGASDVRVTPFGLGDRIIVSGGGGGGGSDNYGSGTGGDGGGLIGGDGSPLQSSFSNILAGLGGTEVSGGASFQCCGPNYPNENGSFGYGGACWHDGASCGGGGGGWYGGGAGSFAPGGGGSSYIGWPGSTNTGTLSGVQYGHGQVIISYTP